MNKRKICVFTGTRAEYGLLFWVIKNIQEDTSLELQLIASGMHLSPEFGLTYQEIELDGFHINKKIEILLSSDSTVGISKSLGLGVISYAEALDELKPDVLLVLGDRFEVFAAVAAAMINRVPVAHCHGGEATEGLIDEAIRHSITKMSQIHFTSTEKYRNRVIQLGEQADRVFNVGALGIESINKMNLLSKAEFEKSIGRRLNILNFLVTFHPVTLELCSAERQFRDLLEVLKGFNNCLVIFTKANADAGGRVINQLIDKFVVENKDKSVCFDSLGQLRYLSAIQFVDVVVGNSSSGLIEVPSFKKPTINIGDRQKGRVRGETVIDCDPTIEAITKAFELALDSTFKEQIKNAVNPYGTSDSSRRVVQILKELELKDILKKKFNDIL